MRILNLSLLLLFGFIMINQAQSLYDIQGAKIATKISPNQLNVTGSIFDLENGKMIEVLNGERREEQEINYTSRNGNQVEYYNAKDELIGYYIPSEKRYYRVDAKRSKDDHVALLYDGYVYTIDENPTFKVDEGFDPELIGNVLFFFLGY